MLMEKNNNCAYSLCSKIQVSWHVAVSPEEVFRYRVMAYVISLFKLGVVLLARPGFSPPKGTAS